VPLLVFVFGCSGISDRSKPVSLPEEGARARATVSLATWNLEWLNGTPGEGNVPRQEPDYEALRRYARKLKADVIAVQEVADVNAATRVFPVTEYEYLLTTHGGLQRVGFVIRKGIPWRANPEYDALDVTGGLRSGADITIFPDSTPLRLLAIHLKSGCFDRPLDSAVPECVLLRQQLPVLEDWIDRRAEEPIPFLVIGDFNRRLKDADEFWRAIDDAQPFNADLEISSHGIKPQCHQGQYQEFIDHLVTDRRSTTRFLSGSFREVLYSLDDEAEFKLSDHCPLRITVRRSE
jgi:endonuclease/exonuclease/phosphatase family metal-dependent hydrolase